MIEITDNEFAVLRRFLMLTCGIEVPPAKRYLFVARLQGMLSDLGCVSFSRLYQRLRREHPSGKLCEQFIEAMTTNETSFYRDQHPFDAVRSDILPTLAAQRQRMSASGQASSFRILSAGCSTGEEPYTLGMCVHEWLRTQSVFGPQHVRILGVDVSRPVLERARRGIYDPTVSEQTLPKLLRTRYLCPAAHGVRVAAEVRAMVQFSRVNLTEVWDSIGEFDIVFCRNVLMYLTMDARERVVHQISTVLRPGGVLVLGVSENLSGLSDRFALRRERSTTYYVTPIDEDDGSRSAWDAHSRTAR